MLQATLGLSIDAWTETVDLSDPVLPAGLDRLKITGLEVGGAVVDLNIQHADGRVETHLLRPASPAVTLGAATSGFERAAYAERYELETANGQWVDSRVLARQALARLDRSALESRMASAGQ